MKRQLILLLLCNLIGCFTAQLIAQNSPLPPINTHPVWEIQIVGQTEVIYDTLTYGQRYCRCGQDYVAIVRNGEEDIMYMRQTSDKAFYLLDIDDCATERLLYDYSTDTVQIPVQNVLFITDSFDLFTYTLNQEEPAGMFQISGTLARFTYQLGPFTLNSQAIWLRGVGDIDHPLFPLFNNYNDSATESRYHLARLTVDHQVWYDASSLEPTSVEIIYVDQDAGAGQQNGSSWADAYTNLNVALQSANAGDWVWVAEGIYTPGHGTARDTAFELRNGIQLFGGFNGTETYLPDRGDPALHATILSGDIGVLGDSTDNSYHVLRIQDVADFALLDGFTIRDGNALGGNVSFPFTENGAGILIYAGQPTTNTGSIVLKNLILTQHTALNGSAISIADGFPIPLRLSISQCTIHHNYAMQRGAGLFTPWSLAQALDVSITDSEFRANRFRSGGGGAIYDYHAKTNWNVVNTVFAENGPVVGGGGGGGA